MYDRSTNSHFKWTKKWGAAHDALRVLSSLLTRCVSFHLRVLSSLLTRCVSFHLVLSSFDALRVLSSVSFHLCPFRVLSSCVLSSFSSFDALRVLSSFRVLSSSFHLSFHLTVLPAPILDVDYEETVADLESVVPTDRRVRPGVGIGMP